MAVTSVVFYLDLSDGLFSQTVMFTSNPGAHRFRSSVNYKIRRQGTATEYSVFFFNTRSDPDPRWKNLNKLEETIFHECPSRVPSHSKGVHKLN